MRVHSWWRARVKDLKLLRLVRAMIENINTKRWLRVEVKGPSEGLREQNYYYQKVLDLLELGLEGGVIWGTMKQPSSLRFLLDLMLFVTSLDSLKLIIWPPNEMFEDGHWWVGKIGGGGSALGEENEQLRLLFSKSTSQTGNTSPTVCWPFPTIVNHTYNVVILTSVWFCSLVITKKSGWTLFTAEKESENQWDFKSDLWLGWFFAQIIVWICLLHGSLLTRLTWKTKSLKT